MIHSTSNNQASVYWTPNAHDGTWLKSSIKAYDQDGASVILGRSDIGTAEDVYHADGTTILNYYAPPVPLSLVGWYKGEGDTSDSVNGNTATWKKTTPMMGTTPGCNPAYDTGTVGQCFKIQSAFNSFAMGYNSYIEIPYTTYVDFASTSSFKFSLSFYFPSMNQSITLITKSNALYSGNEWKLRALVGGSLQLTMGVLNQNYAGYFTTGVWYDLDLEYNNGTWDVYRNSIQMTPDAYQNMPVNQSNQYKILFGGSPIPSYAFFDEVKIYK